MEGCLFCQIVEGKKDAEIVYEDETLVVFKDIHPHAPVHLLLVPRRHIRSINDLTVADRDTVAALVMKAPEIASRASVARTGYKLVFNVERGAGQVIFHLHLHLRARQKINGPSGSSFCPPASLRKGHVHPVHLAFPRLADRPLAHAIRTRCARVVRPLPAPRVKPSY
ncbi:MAG: HIT domain-containing protein [Syntrophorhabdales bacterium]